MTATDQNKRIGVLGMTLGLACLLLIGVMAVVAAAPAGEEIRLTGCILGCDLNLNDDGRLTISDFDARELWLIEPATGVYTTYDVQGRIVDARSDGDGHIWWTDSADTFSRLTLSTDLQTTWVLTNFESLSGVAIDDANRIWFSEWFGSESKLHRFDPAVNQWCSYAYAGAGYSYYLLADGDVFWSLNWFSEHIVRFDPGAMSIKRWSMSKPVVEPYAMAMDQDGLLWWSDRSNHLYSLDPASDTQRVYVLPQGTGSIVQRVETSAGLVWYAESVSGTLGALDPVVAAGITTTLAASAGPAAESCVTVTPEPDVLVSKASGELAWSDMPVTTIHDADGWLAYKLPENAAPQGLAQVGNYQWATDTGRRSLVRLAISRGGRLSLDVAADPAAAFHGQAITYTYQVTYTSQDDSAANNIVVVDDRCANVSFNGGDVDGNNKLDVNEIWTYGCLSAVPAHEAAEQNPLLNTATVNGEDADGQTLNAAQDTAEILIHHRLGQLAVEKIGPASAIHGQIITFTYGLSYQSDDNAPAQQITLSDDKCDPVAGPEPAGDGNHDGLLDGGETWIYHCLMIVPEHDENEADPLVNEATAGGQNLDGQPLLPATDKHETDIIHIAGPLYLPMIVRS